MGAEPGDEFDQLYGAVLRFLGAWHAYMREERPNEVDDEEISDDALLVHHAIGELRDACDAILNW